MNPITKQKIKTYAIAIAIPVSVGLLSALLTMGNMQIYETLRIPPLAPPAILFPIVWTVLYVLMGVSSGMIWSRREQDPRRARRGLVYYAVSLVFNFFWSILFFRLRLFLFSFFWLLALLYLIIRTMLAYERVYPTAAYLQIPYLFWVSFAGYLNFAIWFLNR